MIYLTPGVIDDYVKTFEQLKELQDLPMSVTIVKIANEQLDESDDFMQMMMDLEQTFVKCNRQYLNVIHFEDYRKKLSKFRDILAKKIPFLAQNYLENNNVFAYDLHGEDYATQKSIQIKLQQVMSDQDEDVQIELARRESMVGLKDYVKKLEFNKGRLKC